MNSIWMKIALGAVVIVVAIVVVGNFMSGESASAPPSAEEQEEPKTVYDMAERDQQFAEQPKAAEPEPETPPAVPPEQPAPSQPVQEVTQPPAQPNSGVILPSSITRATTMYFKPMGEIEDIEAQRLLPMMTTGRSIGRLPMTHFKLMVDGCRQVLRRWPDSWYAFRAKQMLEEMPERFWRNYKVTEEELDISQFLKQRRGTQPHTVEPVR